MFGASTAVGAAAAEADAAAALAAAAADLGYEKDFAAAYAMGKRVGKGGGGEVFRATRRADSVAFAVKVMPKVLRDPAATPARRAAHLGAVRNEAEVLFALRGTLSVAALEAVFEDEDRVLLVMELCTGGMILEAAGTRKAAAYSERAVASVMRAVLQTLAQCHSRHILHRDVKPENFLYASPELGAVKAIDFGLAARFAPDALPVTAASVEGTPWFLAPEACRGRWWPATDVWAAGVMAAYMLTGHYPYIDPVTPETPDLARTLKAIVAGGEPDWAAPHWAALSEGARAFVRALLVHDPAGRPSAAAAMALPWLADPARHATERPLHRSVVQRIQRFGQTSLFRRTVLEHVARDLVALHYAPGGAAARNRSLRGGGSARGGTGLRGFLEKSFHGRERGEGSAAEERSVKGFLERSFRGRTLSKGSAAGERSLKGFLERSFRGRTFSDASVRSARSTGSGGDGPIATPYSRRLAVVLDALDADADGNVDRPRLRAALDALGYRLGAREADDLFAIVDVAGAGVVSRAQVAAALVDWRWVADAHRERWVAAAQRVFEGLDADGDGALSEAEIAGALGGQLSEWEVGAAVRGALAEAAADDEGAAAGGGAGGAAPTAVDFDAFLRILSAPPELDDLELYDDRLSVHASRRASRDMGPPAGAGGCCSIS